MLLHVLRITVVAGQCHGDSSEDLEASRIIRHLWEAYYLEKTQSTYMRLDGTLCTKEEPSSIRVSLIVQDCPLSIEWDVEPVREALARQSGPPYINDCAPPSI